MSLNLVRFWKCLRMLENYSASQPIGDLVPSPPYKNRQTNQLARAKQRQYRAVKSQNLTLLGLY